MIFKAADLTILPSFTESLTIKDQVTWTEGSLSSCLELVPVTVHVYTWNSSPCFGSSGDFLFLVDSFMMDLRLKCFLLSASSSSIKSSSSPCKRNRYTAVNHFNIGLYTSSLNAKVYLYS